LDSNQSTAIISTESNGHYLQSPLKRRITAIKTALKRSLVAR
jgi:hypothetical protein